MMVLYEEEEIMRSYLEEIADGTGLSVEEVKQLTKQ